MLKRRIPEILIENRIKIILIQVYSSIMKFGKNADGKFPHHIFWKEANMPTAKMFRYEHTKVRA